MHRREPAQPEWLLRLGQEQLWRRDTVAAESLFIRAGRYPAALQARALLAVAREDAAGARPLLSAALAAGGDTTRLEVALARVEGNEERWTPAATAVALGLKKARVTFLHPFPHDMLEEVLEAMALAGPPDTARQLVAEAGRLRPGWAAMYELDGLAALRLGDCRAARGRFLALEQFGVWRADADQLLARCHRLLQN
jgi:hypothetical protein